MIHVIDRPERRKQIEILLASCCIDDAQRQMVIDMYGFETGNPMTLEATAQKHAQAQGLANFSRERVRQIVSDDKT